MTSVIAIFDIGKTNKKLFLFDERYQIVHEETKQFDNILDEDGEACEDIVKLSIWIQITLASTLLQLDFNIKAVNFTSYGASFVLLDENLDVCAPLYNYLKPFPENLKSAFLKQYGGERKIAVETASRFLGNLNSGLQLYALKKQKPNIYKKIKYALHLPQYLSFLITKNLVSDMTSIGCHTALWDFTKTDYHHWVFSEKIDALLAPIVVSDTAFEIKINEKKILIGVGLHDSSASLIPYLLTFKEPFILISTGTWCVSMNPFNSKPLTVDELNSDCSCYLSYLARPVKASKIFAGNEHEIQVQRISNHFACEKDFYKDLVFETSEFIIEQNEITKFEFNSLKSNFGERSLNGFKNEIQAYYQLIMDLVEWQFYSTNLIIKNTPIENIYIDGGFSKNSIYMHTLAKKFKGINVYAATVAQSTALGAALFFYEMVGWKNNQLIETKLIK